VGEGHYRGGYDFSGQLELARELRQRATPAEAFAWELLRDRRFLGLKFRRQHQIGDYVVDFHCDEMKLVVELDGAVHDTSKRREVDHKRDAYLKALGLTVLRVPNQDLLDQTEETLREIAQAITRFPLGRGASEGASEALHTPSPFGRGAGGEGRLRDRRGETLFIDARKMGTMVDRVHRELTEDDVARIANTYHLWRGDPHPGPLPEGEEKRQYRGGFDFSGLVETARELRKNQTPAEEVMWELLRDRRFLGLNFRRQHQIGEYVVDFYSDEHRLVVELDGPVHDAPKQSKKDGTRDAYLRALGLAVLRFPNESFLTDPEAILNEVGRSLASPLGRGGGEGDIYRDVLGFCKSATLDEIRAHGHVLTPGRYVGAEEAEDDGEPFDEKMKRLTATLREQQAEAAKLDGAIAKDLKELGYGG
jgi:type I restriction enzyme M protein